MNDYFESSTLSLVLSWILCLPIIIGLFGYLISLLFEKQEGLPRIFTIWLLLCIIILSPARYLVLQLIVATAYPVQSFSAFFSFFILTLYIPIVYGLLYIIGFGLPITIVILIAGMKEKFSKIRILLSAICAPFLFFVFSMIFYFVLPYAGYATHWLNTNDVIGATNGPAAIYYEYVAEKFTPLTMISFTDRIGIDNMSSKQILRAHVASIYLGDDQSAFYFYKEYPKIFEDAMNEHKNDKD